MEDNCNFEPLMDVETAAKSLCLHPKTLMRMARGRRIPASEWGATGFSVPPLSTRGFPINYNPDKPN